MDHRYWSRVICSVLALTGWAVASGPAGAALYKGTYHPIYGAPFDDPRMAWGGTLTVAVDDACVQPGNVSLLSCPGGIAITQATVDLFEADAAGNPTGGLHQTLDFGVQPGILGLNWLLTFGSDENLTGVRSTAFNAIQGDAGALTMWDNFHQAWFSLQFLGDYAQLYWFDKEPLNVDEVLLTAGGSVGPFTIGQICRSTRTVTIPGWLPVNPDYCGWSDPNKFSDGALITFERIPEPATYTLVAAALALMGVTGLLSRRRHAEKSVA